MERWQEYDCPDSGIDFDLADESMVYEGDAFPCSGCGGTHVATDALIQQYERDGQSPLTVTRAVPLQRRPTPA